MEVQDGIPTAFLGIWNWVFTILIIKTLKGVLRTAKIIEVVDGHSRTRPSNASAAAQDMDGIRDVQDRP